MPTERVIEIPWALSVMPQTGEILDIGSCDATYLHVIQQHDRRLTCMDPRPCVAALPKGASLCQENLIGNSLPAGAFDAVLLLSTLEHVGLPCYGNTPFADGDRLALAEAQRLLVPQGCLIVTVPAGRPKLTSWYRQYDPDTLHTLFENWDVSIRYWGFNGQAYIDIIEADVVKYDYRDQPTIGSGAGALAGIVARPTHYLSNRGSTPG